MSNPETERKLEELAKEIAHLPEGSLGTKTIRGKQYFYHRFMVDGKRREKYIDARQAAELREQIEKRKSLKQQWKECKAAAVSEKKPKRRQHSGSASVFHTYIRIGNTLRNYALPVKSFRKRACFSALQDYLADEGCEKVLILYGLRRTGKTTLIRQAICEMNPEEAAQTAFIQIKSSDTLADVNMDMKKLEESGYRTVFIDEVTLMKDFVEGAALFSDIFAASGMKIVLSGTDSLGFLFSEDEQLFDRCRMIHTTIIPYREFESVLGRSGIDEYIRYGGTMSLSGRNYNEDSVFSDPRRANEYVDSAIAKNIQHSLTCYQDGSHFRALRELYDRDELTGAINRVVEDMNHRFTVETLTRTFVSNDMAISAGNLRRDRNTPSNLLDRIDVVSVTEKLKTYLEILNQEEQRVQIREDHAEEIGEYLQLLDLVVRIPIRHVPASRQNVDIPVITQPGLRYVQAEALIQSIISDDTFDSADILEKNMVLERIQSEIMGRMMEEIVLLETTLACPKRRVFKLQFAVGEFDMVIFDPETVSCKIYEIKHSTEIVPAQYRHLTDASKCAATEQRFGKITGKYVIYRGTPAESGDIGYLNVEEYLRNLE